MARIPKAIMKAAEDEARRHGVTISFERGSKHPWIMSVARNDNHRRVSLSLNNPKHQEDWIRQDVRRLSRELP